MGKPEQGGLFVEATGRRMADISATTLKVVALAAMLVDHMATGFVPAGTPLALAMHTAGRMAAPIYCFCIAQGYHHTRDLHRYLLRLLGFAALSHFPYVWYFGLRWWKTTSVFWPLFLGLAALAAAKQEGWAPWKRLLAVAACCLLALPGDWSYIAVLWILGFGLFYGRFELQAIAYSLVGFFFYLLPGLAAGPSGAARLGILLVLPLLALYHGRKGHCPTALKWGFYLFYPAHLLVLYLLRLLV